MGLISAVDFGRIDEVMFCLAAGCDVNQRSTCTTRWEGFTALMIATARGDIDCMAILIRNGADVDAQSKQLNKGNTALIESINYGFWDCAELLIAAGANLDLQGTQGDTALHLLCSKSMRLNWETDDGSELILTRLLTAGANPNIENSFGITALTQAALNVDVQLMILLLDAQGDMNCGSFNGKTVAELIDGSKLNNSKYQLLREAIESYFENREIQSCICTENSMAEAVLTF